ncbi:phospholipase A and acyltransferase 2 [Microcaecilia unicolor]|uniref:Phospholipase A and acyltransferase 2-like n=1 Tax=Microcaecilia unicolor TaxID=1415580 RepID=A0A6P7ZD52_9AMPH|nr:phospholipase A and acyltransferase 2-like [Microcaecilia unicolor]XP_030074426.1 phospholipase A and acyltransferase 2-like [Microcaecilia unicolor]
MPPVTIEPELGDLIEISRFGYQHWAIYVGNDYVIHLAPPSEYAGAGSSSLTSALIEYAEVRKDRLSLVVGSSSYWVNNKYDKKYRPYPVKEILQRAKERVGEILPYSVTSYNCEHFVTEVRYNQAESEQVDKTIATAGWVALGAVVGFAALAAVATSRNKREKQ